MQASVTLREALEAAKRVGVCAQALTEISRMADWDEFSRHRNAPYWAYWYACNVAQGQVRDMEPIIARDPEFAYRYARHVVLGRWPEAEPVIAKDPASAYYYARDVIRGPWPEAEVA